MIWSLGLRLVLGVEGLESKGSLMHDFGFRVEIGGKNSLREIYDPRGLARQSVKSLDTQTYRHTYIHTAIHPSIHPSIHTYIAIVVYTYVCVYVYTYVWANCPEGFPILRRPTSLEKEYRTALLLESRV